MRNRTEAGSGGVATLRGVQNVFHINTLVVFGSPTKDKSGHREHARTQEGQVFARSAGTTFFR